MLCITHNLSRKRRKAWKDSITKIYDNNGLLNSDRVIVYLIKIFPSSFCFLSAFCFASSKLFMYLPLSASPLSCFNSPDENKENTFGLRNEKNFKKVRSL